MASAAIKVYFNSALLQKAIDAHSNTAALAKMCDMNPGTLRYIVGQGKGSIEYVLKIIHALDLEDPGAIFDLNGYLYKLNKLSKGDVILSYRVDHRRNGV